MYRKLNGVCVSVCLVTVVGGAMAPALAGPYTEAGIASGSPLFVDWASGVEVVRGPQDIANPTGTSASYGTADAARGPANNGIVSLGDGGYATLTFTQAIYDGAGPDFAVFENSFASGSNVFAELAYVEVSSNGTDFFRFPSVSLTSAATQVGGFGTVDATNLYNLAGKHVALQGTPFDLSELAGLSPLLDVNHVTVVRVRDVVGRITPVGDYSPSLDALGNSINDPYATPFASGGFDLDAVGAIHVVPEPATLGLLSLGAVALLRRRRDRAERAAARVDRPARAGRVLAPALVALGVLATPALADIWASQLVAAQTFGPFHSSALWSDPTAVLGKVNTLDRDDTGSGKFRQINMCWPAWYQGTNDPSWAGQTYNQALCSNNGTGLRQGCQIVIAFDQPVVNNPDDGGAYNWGVDFIVHGNSFFVGQGMTHYDTNMEEYRVAAGGGLFAEPVTVSVAQTLDGPWYTFTTPTADNYFPTQPWAWDRTTHAWSQQELDWSKPVNPHLTGADFGGLTVADAIDLYGGSAGGTGFDIGVFGLDWIQYVKVSDPSGNAGEICGFADVAVPEPTSVLLLAAAGLIRRRR